MLYRDKSYPRTNIFKKYIKAYENNVIRSQAKPQINLVSPS